MKSTAARCLILSCGNTLRGDDGVGPWLSAWAEERYEREPSVCALNRQQWTPDLAEDVAAAEFVLFIDCSVESSAGQVRITAIEPAAAGPGLASHHVGAPELLALGQELYDALPRSAFLLTVGAESTELGESFSKKVIDALPEACRLIEAIVRDLLATPTGSPSLSARSRQV